MTIYASHRLCLPIVNSRGKWCIRYYSLSKLSGRSASPVEAGLETVQGDKLTAMLSFIKFFANSENTMSFTLPESVKVWLQFVHPALMWVLLALTFYALYLGIQIQRTRTADSELKKELIKGRFNIRHYQIGSILLAAMIVNTLVGMGVTYINNAKLFVGPHLLAGLGMTGLIATAAALSPYMQKGKDWARVTHIVLNVVLLGLFIWQAITGIDILQRIISKM